MLAKKILVGMTLAFMLAAPTTHAEEEDYSDEWSDVAEIPPEDDESTSSNSRIDNSPVSIQDWRREQFGDNRSNREQNPPPESENPPENPPPEVENPPENPPPEIENPPIENPPEQIDPIENPPIEKPPIDNPPDQIDPNENPPDILPGDDEFEPLDNDNKSLENQPPIDDEFLNQPPIDDQFFNKPPIDDESFNRENLPPTEDELFGDENLTPEEIKQQKKDEKKQRKAEKKAEKQFKKDVKKATYKALFSEAPYTYMLNRESIEWKKVPGRMDEYMVDCWICVIKTPKDVRDQAALFMSEIDDLGDREYTLQHYYIRPASRKIQFLSELEIVGYAQNSISERPYSDSHWEILIPGSVEERIYRLVVKEVGTKKATEKGHRSLGEKIEDRLHISIT